MLHYLHPTPLTQTQTLYRQPQTLSHTISLSAVFFLCNKAERTCVLQFAKI